MRRAPPFLYAALLLAACSSPGSSITGGAGGTLADAGADARDDVPVIPPPDGSIVDPCDLPGSVQFTAGGTVTVPGGAPTAPTLDYLHLPVGFCAHYYGTVGNARQLRFSPGSLDLFVASPTTLTTGGGSAGQSAIVILPDANMDGNADAPVTYMSNLPSTQGLLFANSFFYYQDGTKIVRVPYTAGDVTPGAASEQVADITFPADGLHWPKALDISDDGTIYVGNGGSQLDACVTPHTARGSVVKIDSAPGTNMSGTVVAQGLRNPIAVRCLKGHNTCFALELAKDYSATYGGREKMIPIRQGDDWGFPCCATQGLPYQDLLTPPPAGSCDGVAAEINSFIIGDTPFGLDFEMGHWSGMYAGRAFVATHGVAGSWLGTRIVAIPIDPSTGMPTAATTDITDAGGLGNDVGGMLDFATGWYPMNPDPNPAHSWGRPAALAFHPDGRLFVANDWTGVVFWIAQMIQ